MYSGAGTRDSPAAPLKRGTKLLTSRLAMTAVTKRPTAATWPVSLLPTSRLKGSATRPPTIAAPIQGRGKGSPSPPM